MKGQKSSFSVDPLVHMVCSPLRQDLSTHHLLPRELMGKFPAMRNRVNLRLLPLADEQHPLFSRHVSIYCKLSKSHLQPSSKKIFKRWNMELKQAGNPSTLHFLQSQLESSLSRLIPSQEEQESQGWIHQPDFDGCHLHVLNTKSVPTGLWIQWKFDDLTSEQEHTKKQLQSQYPQKPYLPIYKTILLNTYEKKLARFFPEHTTYTFLPICPSTTKLGIILWRLLFLHEEWKFT
ncbi:mitochondrial conserved fungal protein Rrg8 [Schizosaccharomyces osmophilus]|uniref:Mitochondrial conserved fungal protein Rrg8 n=1 Tax=Schizosaccharomyces osmophilus TaxID=2545709 RepID=A0AAF0ATB7_9SCHI|nr:mitochondrial conserved fungal protein Rrg8 [Schizosaccharomyces osmophilus]WBW71386.1 mitochondrial conserved fungal protein Rrg8 [Schizosaccharomyces osmophilus]